MACILSDLLFIGLHRRGDGRYNHDEDDDEGDHSKRDDFAVTGINGVYMLLAFERPIPTKKKKKELSSRGVFSSLFWRTLRLSFLREKSLEEKKNARVDIYGGDVLEKMLSFVVICLLRVAVLKHIAILFEVDFFLKW